MKIAILGWGSLIWDPGELRFQSSWNPTGPLLPIEFSRKSSNDRLTLVLHPEQELQQTYWALSDKTYLNEAISALRHREKTIEKHIHYFVKNVTAHPDIENNIKTNLEKWFGMNGDIDSVIWTGLPSNWEGAFTDEKAVDYLRDLIKQNLAENAKNYIIKAPPLIRTKVRKRVEQEFGWFPQ